MESRTHNRTTSPEESAELEKLVFDLVRERLLKAVGAGGMWTLQFRASTDTDSLFGETISEYIARDIADQIAAPRVVVELTEAPVDIVVENIVVGDIVVGDIVVEDIVVEDIAVEDIVEAVVVDDIQPAADEETTVESVSWSPTPAPTETRGESVDGEQHDEHRMFKPRKAA